MTVNCTFVGYDAGIDMPADADGYCIIGDNIKNMDRSQAGVLFLGERVAIGKRIFGVDISILQDAILTGQANDK